MKRVLAFILFIQLTTSNSNSPNIVAICNRSNYSQPSEFLVQHASNPSPLHNLSVEKSECQTPFTFNWSINIDSSIKSLTGTWITVEINENIQYHYRCHYQPSFTSEQIDLTGIQQLHFSFTLSNVLVQPKHNYFVIGYNLPPSNPGSEENKKDMLFTEYECDSKVTKQPLCDQWEANVSSVLHGGNIIVTFMTSSMFNGYTVTLEKKTHVMNTTEIKEVGKGDKHKVKLTYTEGCEGLTILITATFENTDDECNAALHEVNCTVNRSGLIVAVGSALAFLLILICCYFIRKMLGRCRSGGGSADVVCLQLLVVYPAADCEFQHAVTVLAEFLQHCGDVRVVIDMWERERVAEQGLIRWIHTQAELADIILYILPPHHTHTDDFKVKSAPVVSHHMVSVPASASTLFNLALNLVASSAHDPGQRDKFWVVRLDELDEKRKVPPELRGCRTFVLLRDLQKLHRKISSRPNVQRSVLRRRFTSLTFNHASWKVREALEQLEMRTKMPNCVPQTV